MYAQSAMSCVCQCSIIKPIWENMKKAIEKIITKSIPVDSVFFISGLHPKHCNFTKMEQIIIDMCHLLAKKMIAMFWKQTNSPTVKHLV